MENKETIERQLFLRGLVKLGVSESQVVKWRIEGDSLVVLVDRGILGIPKYILPLDKLPQLPEPDMSRAMPVAESSANVESYDTPRPVELKRALPVERKRRKAGRQ